MAVTPEILRKIGKHLPMLNIHIIHIYFIYKFCLFEPVEEVRPTVELKQQHWELGGPLYHVSILEFGASTCWEGLFHVKEFGMSAKW
jgi:hypothetical protein